MAKLTVQELEQRVKELEEENRELRQQKEDSLDRNLLISILNEIPAFIYLQAQDYTIRYSNKYFNDHFRKPGKGELCYSVLWDRKEPCDVCPTFTVFDKPEMIVWDWHSDTDGKDYQIHDYPFKDIDGSSLVLELGIDITDRKKAEQEREKVIKELEAALHEIETLRGILPICASCKNIRDDNGYWQQIESYLSSHTQAEFTHSICPECTRKLYPELEVDNETSKD